jgi:hypothetical protein
MPLTLNKAAPWASCKKQTARVSSEYPYIFILFEKGKENQLHPPLKSH